MSTVWLLVLICISGTSCPSSGYEVPTQPGDHWYLSKERCQEDGRVVATGMHLADGSEWAFACRITNYVPKELP